MPAAVILLQRALLAGEHLQGVPARGVRGDHLRRVPEAGAVLTGL